MTFETGCFQTCNLKVIFSLTLINTLLLPKLNYAGLILGLLGVLRIILAAVVFPSKCNWQNK